METVAAHIILLPFLGPASSYLSGGLVRFLGVIIGGIGGESNRKFRPIRLCHGRPGRFTNGVGPNDDSPVPRVRVQPMGMRVEGGAAEVI